MTESIDSSRITEANRVVELNDTTRINFTDDSNYSSRLLDSIINLVINNKFFRPEVDQRGKIRRSRENSRVLRIAYDSANMQFFITKNYLLNDLHITSVRFSGRRNPKNSKYRPGFVLEEWSFSSNTDRDSALGLISYVFNHPKSIIMYEKSYPQLIVAPKRLFILTTAAKMWENYVIEYRNIIKSSLEQ